MAADKEGLTLDYLRDFFNDSDGKNLDLESFGSLASDDLDLLHGVMMNNLSIETLKFNSVCT